MPGGGGTIGGGWRCANGICMKWPPVIIIRYHFQFRLYPAGLPGLGENSGMCASANDNPIPDSGGDGTTCPLRGDMPYVPRSVDYSGSPPLQTCEQIPI